MLNMLKKTMKTKIPMQVMMPLAAAMVCSMLCGCGMENGDYGYESSAPAVSATVPSGSVEHPDNEPASAAENPGERIEEMLESADNPAEDDGTDSEKPTGNSDSGSGNSTAGASHSTVRERYEAARNRMSGQTSGKTSGQETTGSSDATADIGTKNSVSENTSSPEDTGSGDATNDTEAKNSVSKNTAADDNAMNSVSEVARLAELRADVEEDRDECFVHVDEDEHNPYDVVWDYGEDYQTYVDAVEDAGMWAVLFDADFYKENYPMLALQYHDDDALLLEHFQTVGVHEGRQASEAFNVAAYMENCSQTLRDAFGVHYECYYFYWALNQDTESKVDAASNGHPLQMTVKLTALQKLEYEKVNEYRAEVDVHDVVIDPEFLAFAGFRAQQDFTGDYTGHAWLRSHADDTYGYLELINADMLGENTVSGKCREYGPSRTPYYLKYRNSQAHYEAMVSGDYFYFGCSNDHWGPDGNGGYKHCQYDLYVDELSTYMNP